MGNIMRSKPVCNQLSAPEKAPENTAVANSPKSRPATATTPTTPVVSTPKSETCPPPPQFPVVKISSSEQRRCARREKRQRDFLHRTTNPFLIFFLRLRSKKPGVRASKIARVAGKRWQEMTDEQRRKYIELANVEKKKRKGRRQRCKNFRSKRRMCKRKKGSDKRG